MINVLAIVAFLCLVFSIAGVQLLGMVSLLLVVVVVVVVVVVAAGGRQRWWWRYEHEVRAAFEVQHVPLCLAGVAEIDFQQIAKSFGEHWHLQRTYAVRTVQDQLSRSRCLRQKHRVVRHATQQQHTL